MQKSLVSKNWLIFYKKKVIENYYFEYSLLGIIQE